MRFSNRHAFAAIGLGFGDEGKGMTVHSLCKNLSNPLVIRYSGGQQAGHTVTLPNGASHVFSNFGSGTLLGVPTYWSRYCSFDPYGVMNEYNQLYNKGFYPKLYIDKRCPITTSFEKKLNQNSKAMEHGTCGVGVGATFMREEGFYSLLAGDLLNPTVFRIKFKLIQDFYKSKGLEVDTSYFSEACEFIMNRLGHAFHFVDHTPHQYENIVWEGSQGLLLDQNFGFFPHVTRSNVGAKNVQEMSYFWPPSEFDVFYITRAFQTRHGNGPMTNEFLPHKIKDNPKETNILNQYQGQFRKSILDLDLLKYAVDRDRATHSQDVSLVITCLDLVEDAWQYTVNGELVTHENEDDFVSAIAKHLDIEAKRVYRVRSPSHTFNPFPEEEGLLERVINSKG